MQVKNCDTTFNFDLNKKLLLSMKIIVIVLLSILTAFFSFNYIEKQIRYPLKYKREVVNISNSYNLNPLLIFSVIKTESNFNKNARSQAGAMGLMQITENTGNYIAELLKKEKYDLMEVETNIEFGCFYLKYLIEKFENLDTALCAYNAGEGNVIIWLKNSKYSSDGVNLQKIPFPETSEYIQKIKKNFAKYSNYYGYIVDKLKEFE